MRRRKGTIHNAEQSRGKWWQPPGGEFRDEDAQAMPYQYADDLTVSPDVRPPRRRHPSPPPLPTRRPMEKSSAARQLLAWPRGFQGLQPRSRLKDKSLSAGAVSPFGAGMDRPGRRSSCTARLIRAGGRTEPVVGQTKTAPPPCPEFGAAIPNRWAHRQGHPFREEHRALSSADACMARPSPNRRPQRLLEVGTPSTLCPLRKYVRGTPLRSAEPSPNEGLPPLPAEAGQATADIRPGAQATVVRPPSPHFLTYHPQVFP